MASVTLVCLLFWIDSRASVIKEELEAGLRLLPEIQEAVLNNQSHEAAEGVRKLKTRTEAARNAAADPAWTLASAIPWIGRSFSATSEVARSADDVVTLGVGPLVEVFESLDWSGLLPTNAGTDLGPLKEAAPQVVSAAHAVSASASRLESIETEGLIPQVSEPLVRVRSQLRAASGTLWAAGNAAELAPVMMGSDQPRRYLLLIQNNAEVRASGGIPTALAVITLEQGKMKLDHQTTANALGRMSESVPVDKEQESIYSTRMGRFMQDVNLTPDFPTAAGTALKIWREKTGDTLDGVISVDPVALGFILDSTGPVTLHDKTVMGFSPEMPTELSGRNVVQTLMSDVYAKIPDTSNQDAYFAAVAKEVFSSLASGSGERKALFDGIGKGVDGRRILLWSAHPIEQNVISKYGVGGAISGESVAPAQFGAYFNDGTGAKMDYYVRRTVQLVEECTGTEYGQVKVRVTSTNTAPVDAATSLPSYVTAGGAFGVAAGSVQTNVIAYGPAQANVETASVDGRKTDFAAHHHANRPVGTVTVTLAPGQSSTVELTFGKIVQHGEPNLVVTPTVQPVKDVVLPTANAACD
ncbi:DUF4012 domain-containing protein [Arthrobacter ginsengisoli]|uniref:DUF4012 domain-containing protein n=1 Tax=Arthrobacter ginsengisoli TaxID=1356565 RepID=UPI00286AF6BC|nr:DUF4012 domain-containing protein [Arthrobacter ginsengisoli]